MSNLGNNIKYLIILIDKAIFLYGLDKEYKTYNNLEKLKV